MKGWKQVWAVAHSAALSWCSHGNVQAHHPEIQEDQKPPVLPQCVAKGTITAQGSPPRQMTPINSDQHH